MELRKSLSTSLRKSPGILVQVAMITALFLLIVFWNNRQQSEALEIVDQMPQLIGGISTLASEMEYPEIARKAQIEGRVIVQFVVDKNGGVRDAVVVRGIGSGCDEEAIRVITKHAKFKPGIHQGSVVPVKMAIPILFKLPSQGDEITQTALEIVDQMPELIGGINTLASEMKYPEIARKAQIEGRVIVQFIVDNNGNVRDASITKGIGSGCDEEAIRVITEHAKFKPGIHQGNIVPVKMQMPIVFKLGSNSA